MLLSNGKVKYNIMKTNELKLAAAMLELAAQKFSNRGCNDVDDNLYEDWADEERKQFVKEYYEWNGDPEEYDSEWLHIPDWALMDYLADKLKTASD